MPPQHDAFGRPTGKSDAPAPASIARPASPRGGPSRPGSSPPNPHAPGWRWPYLLVLLIVGGAGITFTLSAASDWAADQPSTHEFALERDPFGPRSLLRPEALQQAIDTGLAEAKPDERVAGLSAWPNRVLVTLTDPRDQSRWVNVNTAGDVRSTDLRTSAYIAQVPVSRATAVDPAPAARALHRLWKAQQPYARDPTLSAMLDGDNGRISGWQGRVDGVGRDNDVVRTDAAGQIVVR